jgi:hypothetical protein
MLHNVHADAPQLFQTRWTLNFLAGPITRAQIPALNRLCRAAVPAPLAPAGAPAARLRPDSTTQPSAVRGAQAVAAVAAKPAAAVRPPVSDGYSATRPAVPGTLGEYFVAADWGVSQSAAAANLNPGVALVPDGLVYHPALLAQSQVRYLSARYALDYTRHLAALVTQIEGSILRWEDYAWQVYPLESLQSQPLPQTRFAPVAGWLADARRLTALQRDFTDWVYRSGTIKLRANPTLKVVGLPEASLADLREQSSQAARTGMQTELDKINRGFEAKFTALRQKLAKKQGDEEEQKSELDQRKMEEFSASGELLLSIFSKRKRSLTNSLSKRRMAEQARTDLEQVRKELDVLEDQAKELEKQRIQATREVQERWASLVNDQVEIPLSPQKKDIYLELFGVAWLPFYIVRAGAQVLELPAYTPAQK